MLYRLSMGDRERLGYWATVGAVALGSGTAGVLGLVLALPVGLLFVGSAAVVLYDGEGTSAQRELLIDLVPAVVGLPCMALCTALAVYSIVERREESTFTKAPVYAAGRTTVWAATITNCAAFGLLNVFGFGALASLIFRPWLWPLYVLPIGLGARFIALRMAPGT